MFRYEGIWVFYKGFGILLMGMILVSVLYMIVFEMIKSNVGLVSIRVGLLGVCVVIIV